MDTILDQLTKEQDHLTQLIEAVKDLPDLEKIYNTSPFDNRGVIITMPCDLEAFGRNRDKLLAAGWEWDKNMSVHPHCGEIMPDFWKGGAYLYFHINPDYSGSTCKKRIIGHEEKPVYEIVCLEMEE